jgi:hypothetical protein
MNRPPLWDFSRSELFHWRTELDGWGRRQKASFHPDWLWERYQRDLLGTLNYIARKHRVSIASVALRWALQFDSERVGTVVTTCSLQEDTKTGRPFDRHVRLREVFRFELDEEDMTQLKALSSNGQEDDADDDEQANQYYEENNIEGRDWQDMEEEFLRSGVFHEKKASAANTKIDFNNRKLWL